MKKKAVALFTLAAFLLFSSSCVYKIRQEDARAVAKLETGTKVLALQTKSGAYFEFGAAYPAHIKGKSVHGEVLQTKEFSLDEIDHISAPAKQKPGRLFTKDGKSYRLLEWRQTGDKYACRVYAPVAIPISEVQMGWVKTVNTGASVLQVLGVILIVGLVVLMVASDTESGTDFVGAMVDSVPDAPPPPPPAYRDFYENQIVDAELRNVTAGEPFTVTEWAPVDCSEEPDGQAKFLFGNELGEPKSIDMLKVVVADHPPGTAVAPDVEGVMHVLAAPVPPRRARDRRGRDILPLVEKDDRVFWTSPDEVRDPKSKDDLRDELVFEFPMPEAVPRARLMVSATNTMWASEFAGRFLGLPGAPAVKPKDPAKPDMSGGRARDWYREEEFYKLNVWVETKNGWLRRQTVFGGGPFVPRDKVYPMEIGDVPGPVLKIKILPPANFWMIDRVAVDFGDDLRAEVNEVDPAVARAPGLENQAVMAALADADGRCLDLPGPTDRVEVTFTPPAPNPALARTVFVRTVNRYVLRPDLGRLAPAETARRMAEEPGFAARHALEAYQIWEAALRARLERDGGR